MDNIAINYIWKDCHKYKLQHYIDLVCDAQSYLVGTLNYYPGAMLGFSADRKTDSDALRMCVIGIRSGLTLLATSSLLGILPLSF